jgi:hypothetical protein
MIRRQASAQLQRRRIEYQGGSRDHGGHAFFDGPEHDSPVYWAQAAIYVDSLTRAVELRREHRVLDFGCGFGLVTLGAACCPGLVVGGLLRLRKDAPLFPARPARSGRGD